ncbi:unnamed protein product [Rodentolepis nana]|uniref:AcidPPc domain-containing protein n=1 Tax=Rodentolepis nana TaxID=102285 RepID=A0A0R3T420_RODNA|nr:unnamed protein product [Rodentolepis nana]
MSGLKYFLLRFLYDFIGIIPFVILAAGIYAVPPFERGYFADDQSLKYPYRDSTVPSIYLLTVAPLLAILIIVIIELLRARNYGFSSKYNGVYLVAFCLYKFLFLLLFGYAVTASFVHVGKIVAGELRPHFHDVCNPSPVTTSPYGYVTNFTCLGSDQKRINEMRLSFPSGHSAYSMYPAMFIAVYIHYRMPDIAVGSALQAFIQVCGITAAFYVGLTRITDNKHHPHDVLVGFIIGAAVAIFTVSFYSLLAPFCLFLLLLSVFSQHLESANHLPTVRYATDVKEFDEVEEAGEERSLISWSDSKEVIMYTKEKSP